MVCFFKHFFPGVCCAPVFFSNGATGTVRNCFSRRKRIGSMRRRVPTPLAAGATGPSTPACSSGSRREAGIEIVALRAATARLRGRGGLVQLLLRRLLGLIASVPAAPVPAASEAASSVPPGILALQKRSAFPSPAGARGPWHTPYAFVASGEPWMTFFIFP